MVGDLLMNLYYWAEASRLLVSTMCAKLRRMYSPLLKLLLSDFMMGSRSSNSYIYEKKQNFMADCAVYFFKLGVWRRFI